MSYVHINALVHLQFVASFKGHCGTFLFPYFIDTPANIVVTLDRLEVTVAIAHHIPLIPCAVPCTRPFRNWFRFRFGGTLPLVALKIGLVDALGDSLVAATGVRFTI